MAALSAGANLAVYKPDLQSLEIVDADTVYQNGLVALSAGEIKDYSGAAGETPIGIAQETVLGNAESPAARAMVDVGPKVLKKVDVSGVTAISDVGAIVYLNTDNFADLTLTRPTRGVPIGFVTRWYSGDDCDVQVFSWAELVLVGFAGNGADLVHLGHFTAANVTAADLIKATIPYRYRVISAYAVVEKALAGGTSITITLKKGSTALTGGVITFGTDAAAAKVDASAITQNANSILSESDTLTGTFAVSGTYTAGTFNVFAIVRKLPGA